MPFASLLLRPCVLRLAELLLIGVESKLETSTPNLLGYLGRHAATDIRAELLQQRTREQVLVEARAPVEVARERLCLS